jgi:hypothetical protein
MTQNFFDQFDSEAQTAGAKGNFFDQFDSEAPAPQQPQQQQRGDGVGARLAGEPQQQPQQPVQTPAADVSGMDRVNYLSGGFNKGIFDIVDFPSTALNFGLDLAGAPAQVRSGVPSEYFNIREDYTRVPEAVKNTPTPAMDAARTGLEWGAGAALPTSMMAKVPDLLAAGGAMLGEQIGGDTGELIGGVTGGLSPVTFKALGALVTGSKQTPEVEAVLAFLRSNMSPQQLIDAKNAVKAALARGEKGTLSDLSGSNKLADIEASASKDSDVREALIPKYQERKDQIGEQFSGISPSTGDSPTQPISDSLNTMNAQAVADQQASIAGATGSRQAVEAESIAAQQAAEAADAAMGGTGRTDKSSAALSGEYDKYATELRATLDGPAWEKFDASTQMDVAEIKADIALYAKDLPQMMRADMFKKFNSVLRNVKNLGEGAEGIADPKDVQYVLSAIKDINRSAAATGDFGTLNTKLSDISRIVDDAMRESPEVGGAFKDAIEATVKKKVMLGGDVLSKARRAEPELFGEVANFKGDRGAVTMRNIKESQNPDIMAGTEAHLREIFRKEGVTEATLTNYAAALDEFPALKGQVETVIKTGDTAALAKTADTKAGSTLTKSIAAANAKAAEQLTGISGLGMSKYVSKPKAYMASTLSAADDSGELGKIYKHLQEKSPSAAAEFKSTAMASLKDDVLRVDDLKAENSTAVTNKLNRLLDNGIISLDDMKEVSNVISMQEGRRLRRSGGSVKTPAASANIMDDVVSTVVAYPVLSTMPGGHQLMVAGTIKSVLKRIMRDSHSDPKVLTQLADMLKSPEVFIRALDGKITPKSSPKELNAAVTGAIRTIANASTDQMAQ